MSPCSAIITALSTSEEFMDKKFTFVSIQLLCASETYPYPAPVQSRCMCWECVRGTVVCRTVRL